MTSRHRANGPSSSTNYLRKGWRQATSRFATRVHVHLAGKHSLRAHGTRILKGIGGGLGYAALIEPRWVERTHIAFTIPGLHPQLDGYRIVHLTDIHHNLVSGRGFLQRVVEMTNGLDPDLVALTGDYVTHNSERIWGCFDVLSHLHAPDGVVATRGNHDYRCSLETILHVCREAKVQLLENEHVIIRPNRHRGSITDHTKGEPAFVLGGVADLWEGVVDLEATFDKAPNDLPRLLLSHNPMVAETIPKSLGIALQLSGHTHGGQMRPFPRAFHRFNHGDPKYMSGIVEAPGTTVYISRGVGTSALHMRWNCRPEIALISLHRPLD